MLKTIKYYHKISANYQNSMSNWVKYKNVLT